MTTSNRASVYDVEQFRLAVARPRYEAEAAPPFGCGQLSVSRAGQRAHPTSSDTAAESGREDPHLPVRRASALSPLDAEQQCRLISETAPDGIVTIDGSSKILFANTAIERIFGHRSSELVGRDLSILIPVALRDSHRQAVARYLRSGERGIQWNSIELPGLHRDGHEIPLEISFGEMQSAGRKLFTGIIRDITDRKRIEAEREQLLAAAEAASHAKDQFLATVSHELRTPLTSIIGWVQLLRESACDPEIVDQALRSIENGARMQSELINDILDVSRITAGKLRLETQSVALAEVIQAAAGALRPAADARGVEVHLLLTGGPEVLGDPSRLQQVMWNLLSNAIKFTGRGGHVDVTTRVEGDSIVIAVADTGEGIAAERLNKIFEKFYQVIENRAGGIGLGLSIVRHLVELHGGRVEVFSEGSGKGSCFEVRLPLGGMDERFGAQTAVSPPPTAG
jgi:PAS domain S-box-containing protein